MQYSYYRFGFFYVFLLYGITNILRSFPHPLIQFADIVHAMEFLYGAWLTHQWFQHWVQKVGHRHCPFILSPHREHPPTRVYLPVSRIYQYIHHLSGRRRHLFVVLYHDYRVFLPQVCYHIQIRMFQFRVCLGVIFCHIIHPGISSTQNIYIFYSAWYLFMIKVGVGQCIPQQIHFWIAEVLA